MTDAPVTQDAGAGKTWTFLTNHMRALIQIVRDPHLRVRELADRIDVTERTAMQIVADLEHAGYLQRQRVGRRNTYVVTAHAPLRHPADTGYDIAGLLAYFTRHTAPEAEIITARAALTATRPNRSTTTP